MQEDRAIEDHGIDLSADQHPPALSRELLHPGRKRSRGVFDDIRTLLSIFPMRHEAELRVAISLRLEIDEDRKEVLGENARERIQKVANINRTNTFDAAISSVQELGIFQLERRYSNGVGGRVYQRGAAYVMTRERWPASSPMPERNRSGSRSFPSNNVTNVQQGQRSSVTRAQRKILSAHNGGDGTTLSAEDHYKDNDEVYGEETASAFFAGAFLPGDIASGNDALTTKSEVPPKSPQPPYAHTTNEGNDAAATDVVAPCEETKKLSVHKRGDRGRHRKGLASLDGSEGVVFDIVAGTLNLVNGTRLMLEEEAKKRGLDLGAALTKAATRIATRPTGATAVSALTEVRQALQWQADDRNKAVNAPSRGRSGGGRSSRWHSNNGFN